MEYTRPKGSKAQFEIIHYGEGQIHMKCPICGQELRPGKKDPNYLLCYNCKKKFKIPQSAHKVQKRAENRNLKTEVSNIPPKEVREKREQEMRDAYDELLAVGDGKKKKKPAPKPQRREELEDEYYDDIDDEEEEKMSKAPIIILAIAIIVVAGLIAFMLLR